MKRFNADPLANVPAKEYWQNLNYKPNTNEALSTFIKVAYYLFPKSTGIRDPKSQENQGFDIL